MFKFGALFRHFVLLSILFFAFNAGAASIDLAWDAPITNSDGSPITDLAGYKLYMGTASRSYSAPVNVGNVTSFTVNNLRNGQDYFFIVTAYDLSNNESVPSNELKISIPLDATPTPTPTSTPTPTPTSTPTPRSTSTPRSTPTYASTPTSISTPIVTTTPTQNPGRRVKGDYDGDGKIDIGTYKADKGKTIATFLLSASSKMVELEFDAVGREVSGDLNGDGKFEFGVVSVNSEKGLQWQLKDVETGREIRNETFGVAKDKIIGGCFFDPDKISDLAIIHKQTLSIKRSTTGTVTNIRLPKGTIKSAYCGDTKGDRTDKLILLVGNNSLAQKLYVISGTGKIVLSKNVSSAQALISAYSSSGKGESIGIINSLDKELSELRFLRSNGTMSAVTVLPKYRGLEVGRFSDAQEDLAEGIILQTKSQFLLKHFSDKNFQAVDFGLPAGTLVHPVLVR